MPNYKKLIRPEYTAHIFSYNVYNPEDDCEVKILYAGKDQRKTVKQIVEENDNSSKFLCAINGGPFNFDTAEKYFELFSSNLGQIQIHQSDTSNTDDTHRLLNLVLNDGNVSFIAREMLPAEERFTNFGDMKRYSGALQAYGYDFYPNYEHEILSSNIINDDKYKKLYNERYNRTMVAQSMDGNTYFIVTEGKGMTGTEQTQLLMSLNCLQGINLDGGYSCSMYIDDHKNKNEVVGKNKLVTDCIAVYLR